MHYYYYYYIDNSLKVLKVSAIPETFCQSLSTLSTNDIICEAVHVYEQVLIIDTQITHSI